MTYEELLTYEPYYLDWDFEHNGKPFQIVKCMPPWGAGQDNYVCYEIDLEKDERVKGHYIPHNTNISIYNIHQPHKFSPRWEFMIKKHSYVKCKWDDLDMRLTSRTVIYRNGVEFFSFAGDEDYSYHKAKAFLTEIQEGPINFYSRFWKEELNKREIEYCGQPATVRVGYGDGFYMWITPKNGKFKPPYEWDNDTCDVCNREHWNEEYAEGLRVDNPLDPSINWYPSE